MSVLSKIRESTSYSNAVKDAYLVGAMKDGLQPLEANHTWEMVWFPHGKSTIGSKWVY